MHKLTQLEALATAKAIASQFAETDFSVSAFVRQHTRIGVNGITVVPESKVLRSASTVNQHYVAAVCGNAHVDLVKWCKKNARAILALEYR